MAPTISSTTAPGLETVASTSMTALLAPAASYTSDRAVVWILGISLSWFAFAWTMACVCMLSNFIADTSWCNERRERTGDRSAQREHGRRARASSSAAVSESGRESKAGFRRRKPRGLSVDIAIRGSVDGILNSGNHGKKCGARRGDPPPCYRLCEAVTSTAPLPMRESLGRSAAGEGSSFSDDERTLRAPDIETGHAMPRAGDLVDGAREKWASPYFGTEGRGENGEAEEKGWLSRVNGGVYWVADQLAAAFYDDVVGAEQGLLLPVREDERESWSRRTA